MKAVDVAKYLLLLDEEKGLFKDYQKINRNGRDFFVGNARLNKYLHLAQNIYFAKYSELLFEDRIYAYDNGGVVPEVQEHFTYLLNTVKQTDSNEISEKVAVFLKKMYYVLQNASIDRLIDLSHEDPEWKNKNNYYKKEDQIMDTELYLEEYKTRYSDIIRVMDGIHV